MTQAENYAKGIMGFMPDSSNKPYYEAFLAIRNAFIAGMKISPSYETLGRECYESGKRDERFRWIVSRYEEQKELKKKWLDKAYDWWSKVYLMGEPDCYEAFCKYMEDLSI